MKIENVKNGVKLEVVVKPESTEEKLALEGGDLVFYTKEPPLHGRANASLIKFFSRVLNISSSKIDIIHGYRKRNKVLLVREMNKEEVENIIKRVIES
ncbi:MAG TPA: DUF167 domain-containing protein [Thermofilum sp.]|nr:DUF167 domain-containing protein [Thermofilum sp.]